MKIAKTFRLSEQAANILDKQSNATQFLEDLIIQSINHKPISKVVEDYIIESLDEIKAKLDTPTPQTKQKSPDDFDEFMKLYSTPGVKPPHPIYGYPCCHDEAPCKHWAFDETEALWINTLTKETKDA